MAAPSPSIAAARVTRGHSFDLEMSQHLDDLVTRADLDGLVRLIDAECASRDWAHLLEIRAAARQAVQTGRQLWPAATLAEYRLALHAPADIATQVLRGEASRFTLGPLTEVIAQHHTWDQLAEFLPHEPQSTYVAYECALRGNEIANADDLFPALEIPVQRSSWEPQYQLAVYADNEAVFEAPTLPPTSDATTCDTPTKDLTSLDAVTASRIENESVERAARQLVEAWTTQSNGHCTTVLVSGEITNALGALGDLQTTSVNLRALSSQDALKWLAWAGASGGAHGRRRGAATGRFGAWWMLAALGDALHSWPLTAQRAGGIAAQWSWSWWDNGPASGWQLQLVAHNATTNMSWAINAHDAL